MGKENESTVGFFRELNPLSNFHRCVFKVNDKWFQSSEQYIQMKKALYFGDQAAAHTIEAADDALKCKRLSREIESFDPLELVKNLGKILSLSTSSYRLEIRL